MNKSDVPILVEDDDPDYLFQTVFGPEKEGYRIIAAESQAEAEMVISKHKQDLAIFDLMISGSLSIILCRMRSNTTRWEGRPI